MSLSGKDREWITKQLNVLKELIVQNQIDIAVLKVKAGTWGVLGGAATVAVSIGVYWLCSK